MIGRKRARRRGREKWVAGGGQREREREKGRRNVVVCRPCPPHCGPVVLCNKRDDTHCPPPHVSLSLSVRVCVCSGVSTVPTISLYATDWLTSHHRGADLMRWADDTRYAQLRLQCTDSGKGGHDDDVGRGGERGAGKRLDSGILWMQAESPPYSRPHCLSGGGGAAPRGRPTN